MKKICILCFVVCALVASGALYAMHLESTAADTAVTDEVVSLPTNVMEELSADIFCVVKDVQCPDVYDPVTCSNGVTYSNACYAAAACATGCTGGGV
ncbi:MAG: hypothetical protein MPN21_14385 [Thermoanaerobaculia bacterium]|nr:hypothetical protein [Thermoanaerobaculia bacterium]